MKWNSLVSAQNLKLAWKRINTGKNLQYKRFFRESYLVYDSAADEHIKQLRKHLTARAWQPGYATKIYLPKASGLQRPLSLLGIEDQILLQAIANQFARKLYSKRQKVELKTVFSNVLSQPRDSIFFVESWKITYSAFQRKCTTLYERGYEWSVHFDLSAFYDTISHDLLLSIESPRGDDPETENIVREWLQHWSAESGKTKTGHGIPQGPVASDFLAEVFLLPIDISLQERTIEYLRYVDDIRLFGRTENEVREAAILLEQECRELGLIPQSTKYEIRKLTSAEDAMGALPSIAPTDTRDAEEPPMSAAEARGILASTIDGKPQRIIDKSRFRYVMFRAPADTETLRIVRRLLPRHPEHIDAFVAYFSNFGRRRAIARSALDYLEEKVPYPYVRGELWHLIARFAGPEELRRGLPMARLDSKQRTRCIALSWGVMHFLTISEKEGLDRRVTNIRKRLAKEHSISRSLLAPILADSEFTPTGHAATLLKEGNLMEQLAGARELQKRSVTLADLDLQQDDLSMCCRTVLMSLDVIRRRNRTGRDYVMEVLAKLYGCQSLPVWRQLFGTEYEHAWQILREAEARFTGSYSEWLGLQDSFNDIVVRQLFDFLSIRQLRGYSKTKDRNGNLVRYGSLVANGTPFDKMYPQEANALRVMHDRRNKIPVSHPYAQKGGAQNKWLTMDEQSSMVPKLRFALDSIAAVVLQHI